MMDTDWIKRFPVAGKTAKAEILTEGSGPPFLYNEWFFPVS
jgi:hypothetical protein